MNTQSPEQKDSLEKLIPYGKDLLSYCEKINLHPIVYGSLAYIIHTSDTITPINDIDFLISKDRFRDLIELVKQYPDLRFEETTYNSIKVFRGDLKIAFDSIEDYLTNIDFKTSTSNVMDCDFTIVDKATLKAVYQNGINNIPFKSEAYGAKLDKLKSLE